MSGWRNPSTLTCIADELNSPLREWLVYDLGGSTFDVALVRIEAGELRVIDHEGNNYLGGSDFDALIVEKLVVPQLEREGRFTDLLGQMRSASGRYNRDWYRLLRFAEDAKVELSAKTSAEIEVEIEDADGKQIEALITVTRSEYEGIIKETVDKPARMVTTILTRNSLQPQDLEFVLMVGGTTYTPFVRQRVEELLGIPVNTGIGPTSAIALGAAYFASSKEIDTDGALNEDAEQQELKIKVTYNRSSKDLEEIFSAKVEGILDGLFYRISRQDGGYNSGLKALTARLNEDLPLRESEYNLFVLEIYDSSHRPVPTNIGPIQITQGIYSVAGQMLPGDISLVKDAVDASDTILDLIFARNTVLPARATKTVEASKTLVRNTADEIDVTVVQGPAENHFTANKMVGKLVIPGKGLHRDIAAGTEIDLSFQISESQELAVTAYVNPEGPQFKQVFHPEVRSVDVKSLVETIDLLEERLRNETDEAGTEKDRGLSESLQKLYNPATELKAKAGSLSVDDVTDERYQLQDRVREFGQELNLLTLQSQQRRIRAKYQTLKTETTELVRTKGNERERSYLNEIVAREHTFINSTQRSKVDGAIEDLQYIYGQILLRTPEFLVEWFERLQAREQLFQDQEKADRLLATGRNHIESEQYDELANVNSLLQDLLPQKEREAAEMRRFTGIR